MTLVDQVRALKAELRGCEVRAAEIRRTLAEVCEAAETETPALAPPADDEIAFLRLMATGPRTMADFITATDRPRGACLRTLDRLAAAEHALATGKGPGRRWHLTDLGAARVGVGPPDVSANVARVATALQQITM